MKREGHRVNHKRIARLMGEMELCGKAAKRRQCTTNSNREYRRCSNLVMELVIERLDQVWVGDITYIRLQQEFVYLVVLMDVFTRRISPKETLRERGRHLSRSLEVSLTVTALRKGLEKHRPEIHHSDQGVQYAASEYVELLKDGWSQYQYGSGRGGVAEWLRRAVDEND